MQFIKKNSRKIYFFLLLVLSGVTMFYILYQNNTLTTQKTKLDTLRQTEINLLSKNEKLNEKLQILLTEDQYVKNKQQEQDLKNIRSAYLKTVKTYEDLLLLRESGGNTNKSDELIAKSLSLLAEQQYASAEAVLVQINIQIIKEKETLAKKATEITIPKNIPVNNTPPSSGYSRQLVSTEIGNFLIDIVSADLSSTKVIIDTASDNTCTDNCPVLSLAEYVSRSGAFAGINGSYFCPASYPSCAGKTNSFDTLLMNKNKVYFNSENNVYSTVPVAVFGSGWARFMGKSLDWGRDTGIDAVIANQPLLLSGGNIAFTGDGDPKKGSKGQRSFIGNKGTTVYIGVTHNATVAENGYALKALGLENALNLDSGGSTALWSGGYKSGPGRNIPNAVLLIRK